VQAYAAIVSARFRTSLQYRGSALAQTACQFWWGLSIIMVWEAFYRSGTARQPMSLAEVITYTWLGQALLSFMPWNVETDIRELIRTGGVAYELLRPLDLYWHWYIKTAATRLASATLRATPILLVAGAFFHLHAPASLASAGAWALSTVGAVALACAISTFMAIILFWTIAGDGINGLITSLVLVLSGVLVPLPFFPSWAQSILNVLPFRGLIDIPFRLYLGHLPPAEVFPLLALQAVWTVTFLLLGRGLLAHGLRRLVVQGG
jgi:ABC-2 type transport system permease protein